MELIRGNEINYVPAGHENPLSPGVWKKVLFAKSGLLPGNVQMINWSKMPAGKHFAAHYHEDMQEIFIILEGSGELVVDGQSVVLAAGDAVALEPCETHQMFNRTDSDVIYIALGIAAGEGGKSVLVGN
jgi:mannose-6-phosphate isomerase-like protein (cupin superfamily)